MASKISALMSRFEKLDADVAAEQPGRNFVVPKVEKRKSVWFSSRSDLWCWVHTCVCMVAAPRDAVRRGSVR